MKFLTKEEVVSCAQRWVQFWRIIKYRDKMDRVMDGLNEADQRRVRLCGQRMSVGLPLKVLPAPEKEVNSEKANQNKRRRSDETARSTKADKTKTSVGTNSHAAGSSNSRSRPRNQK